MSATRLGFHHPSARLQEDLSWHWDALCAETDPEVFFPEKGEPSDAAKAICTRCPVQAECLDYALRHDERYGVWGGTSERDRRRLRKEAGR